MIQIQDVLVNPINEPMAHASVLLETVVSGETLLDSYAEILADGTGAIDFNLVQGDYRVYLKQTTNSVRYPVGYISKDIFDTITSPTTLAAIIVDTLPEEIA